MIASKRSSWTSHASVKSSTSIPLLSPVGGSTCTLWYALASIIRNELECLKTRVSITEVTKIHKFELANCHFQCSGQAQQDLYTPLTR